MCNTAKFDYVFEIPPDEEGFSDMVGELSYDDEFVCLIHQEKGFDALEIEIYSRKDGQPWKFSLSELETAFSKAKQRLWELRKSPETSEEADSD